MTDNSTASGGNLWLPGTGESKKLSKRPRWLRIAYSWLITSGFVGLAALYLWDWFDEKAASERAVSAIENALDAGEQSVTWTVGGMPLWMGTAVLVPVFALSWFGFTFVRKQFVNDKNKFYKNMWKLTASLQLLFIITLFFGIFTSFNTGNTGRALESRGLSVATFPSEKVEDEALGSVDKTELAVRVDDSLYSLILEESSDLAHISYTLKMPEDFLTAVSESETQAER